MRLAHTTAAKDRIPVAQKIAFGLGSSTPIAFVNTVSNLTGLIYNIGLGINPVLLGLVQMVPRVMDNNTRARLGRPGPPFSSAAS